MTDIEILNGEHDHRGAALELFVQPLRWRERARLMVEKGRAWQRALDENPHRGPELPPRLWYALYRGRLAGILLGVPFCGVCGGLELRGHWGVDLFVPVAHRGKGIGRALLEHWLKESPLALGLGITDLAYPIELSLGFEPVRLPARLVKPLSVRGAIFAGLPGRALVASMRRSRGSDGLDETLSRQVPGDVDNLYQRIAGTLPCHIARDSRFLRWRYAESSPKKWQFLAIKRGGRLEALGVFCIERSRKRSKTWLYELLYDARDEATGQTLVAALLETACIQGADLVEGRLTAGYLTRLLQREGFVSTGARDRFIVHAGAPELKQERLHLREWYLTLGDSGNL